MAATWVLAISSLLGSVSATVAMVVGLHNARKIGNVHAEVKTSNGLTVAALADRGEGRRIETEVPADERTPAEQKYVNGLNEGGRYL